MSAARAQARWAAGIAAGLRASGVSDLVISPGSQSTPLVLATGRFRRHPITDERSAGFFALGLARESQRPVALLCTSGSAAAHYLPALMEAHHGGVCLVVVSADRPSRLVGRGANQTTGQRQLFGRFAEPALDLGDPTSDHRGVTSAVAGAVARGRELGSPVHINARFDKPLEPPIHPGGSADCNPAGAPDPTTDPALAGAATFVSSAGAADPAAITEAAALVASARRGLIVCGPAGPSARAARGPLASLSAASGFPILAEACSQLRFANPAAASGDGLGWLVSRGALDLDLVVQVGAAPVQPVAGDVAHVALCERGTPDPESRVRVFVRGELGPSLAELSARLTEPTDPSWLEEARQHNRRVWAAVEARPPAPSSEPAAVRAVLRATPEHAVVQLGNSLPVRLVDRFCRSGDCRSDVTSQRGLSGIDGAVARAFGTAATGRPVVALLGDVTFQHDVSSLALASRAHSPVVLAVIDNGGARIFDGLPIADHPAGRSVLREFFTTASEFDLGQVAEAFGVAVERPSTADELQQAVAAAAARPGCTVVHARVNPESAHQARKRIEEQLETT